MFIPKIGFDYKVVTYGKLYRVKNVQDFVYLTKEDNFDTIQGVTILDVGVPFEYNGKMYKIIRDDNWIGIKKE